MDAVNGTFGEAGGRRGPGVLYVFIFAFALGPLILFGNAFVLATLYRFKRLRTPSNYFLCSLAASDFAVGLLPPAFFAGSSSVCLVPYSLLLMLSTASVIVMAAIAVDRFTSLAQPLRYNDLITHASVQRYLILFWLYSVAAGFFPLYYGLRSSSGENCFLSSMVNKPVQIFLVCTIYGPSCVIIVSCYSYVFVLARYHARAIYTVETSVSHGAGRRLAGSRYGQTLALTVGSFLLLWTPFQICMLLDIIYGSNFLDDWMSVYLFLPIFASSAVNPWIYAYRNSEMRACVQKVVGELLRKLGLPPQGCSGSHSEQTELNSFASNIRCTSSPQRVTSLLYSKSNMNGKLQKSSLLAVPEGEVDITVTSIPFLDQSVSKDSS